MVRRRKYTNVGMVTVIEDNQYTHRFECCRDAAEWLTDNRISKNVNAARVGISTVLTGKRVKYRGFEITADRI